VGAEQLTESGRELLVITGEVTCRVSLPDHDGALAVVAPVTLSETVWLPPAGMVMLPDTLVPSERIHS
jgi:hypothetical protein